MRTFVGVALATGSAKFLARQRMADEGGGGRSVQRRRLMLLAGFCVAAVLAVGLMWPQEDGGASRGTTPAAGASEDARGGSTSEAADGVVPARARSSADEEDRGTDAATVPTPVGAEGSAGESSDAASVSDDPVRAARGLVRRISACAADQDAACADAVPSGAVIDPTVLASTDDPRVELVDSYGDVAVVRVAGVPGAEETMAEQMIVLVRQDEKWLVRDIYSVADQPE